jgi:hypothetical protein
MSLIFGTERSVITKHILNILKIKELDKSTCAEFAQVQKEGGREIVRNVAYYNLDMIISVGYRVNSIQGVRFRQWATRVLRDHITKGYTLNKDRMQELENLYHYLKDTMTVTTMNINRLRLDSPTKRDISELAQRIDTIKDELNSLKKKAK